MNKFVELIRSPFGYRRDNGELASHQELLLARDGDRCWFCHYKLRPEAKANTSSATTIEHLVSPKQGGSDDLSNKVLCHKRCNGKLANRPLAEKERLRAKRQADRRAKWTAGKGSQ